MDSVIVSATSCVFILFASIFVNFLQHKYLLCKFLLMLFYCFVHWKSFYTEEKIKGTNDFYLSTFFGYSCRLRMFDFVSDSFNLVYKYIIYSYTHVFICRNNEQEFLRSSRRNRFTFSHNFEVCCLNLIQNNYYWFA